MVSRPSLRRGMLTRKLMRDMRAQRTQFLAVALTVFLGITMFGASYDSFQNLEASYAETARVSRFANFTVAGDDVEGFAEAAAAEPGVDVVEVRTVVDVPVAIGESRLLGRVVGVPDGGSINQLTVLDGSLPQVGEVAIEKHLAEHFGLTPGSTVQVLTQERWLEWPVSGVVASAEYIWPAKSRAEVLTTPDNFGVLFADEADVVTIADGEGPNQAVVWFDGGEPNGALEERLMVVAGPSVDAFTREEQPSNAALEEDLRGFEELAVFFPLLFLTAAGMAGHVMINRLVYAQRPQIGILLANGFTRRQVMRHYLGYGLVPGLAGAVPGAIAGVLLARVITGLYTEIISVPVTVIEPHPVTAVAAVVLGVLATLAAAWVPARAASRTVPAESMRGFAVDTRKATRHGRHRSASSSLAERLVPPLRRAPIRYRMGVRGIERNPRRTVSTVLGVVLSLMLVLVSWGMLDTVQLLMDRQFGEIDRQDARVYFTAPVDEAAVDTLEHIDGVMEAEPSLQLPASVMVGASRVATALVALPADTALHGFLDENGEEFGLPSSGVTVSAGLLDTAGLEVGDQIPISVSGFGSLELEVAGTVDEPLGSFLYVSLEQAAQLAGGRLPISAALVAFDEGADPDAVRQAVLAAPGVAAYEDSDAMAEIVRGFMGLFYGFVGVMLAFGAAMAFALIFNAMSVNIAERQREVGTLLAVGVERRTISRLISTENMVVAFIGIPLGLVAGYWVSALAMASFESDMFRLDLEMRPTTMVASALAILAVALLSQRPGLAAIRELDVARIIKERSA